MTEQERAIRARQILDDPVVKDALAEMERRAVEDFIALGVDEDADRRRRIAAEHIRELRDFRKRLEMAIAIGAPKPIRGIA